jgi:threonine dehydrogenase-like Zn-dependent dehydrogenase
MEPGTVLGHEAIGIVEELGEDVTNLRQGDRVVIPSTIGCGSCSYCRSGYFAQCDTANPNGRDAGSTFFGGPKGSGSIDGLQAEYARIPFANVGPMKLPEEMSEEDAILLSDIFPTGYFGAKLAEIRSGDTVAVFGCGPVGIFSIISAFLLGASRVLAIDCLNDRLQQAQSHGAEIINFDEVDPVERLRELTQGIGPDRIIDAVGVDSHAASSGPAAVSDEERHRFDEELKQVAPRVNPQGEHWRPGDAPTQVLRWAVEAIAKSGTISIIGVYPPQLMSFPIGMAMNKNLTMQMGNCNHRKYLPKLIDLVTSGQIKPGSVLTQQEDLMSAIEAYEHFDHRDSGWIKVKLTSSPAHAAAVAS